VRFVHPSEEKDETMSTISAVGAAAYPQPVLQRATDGDPPSVEAAESAATKRAERIDGVDPRTAPPVTSGLNITV
jgi:hypothetical protein